MNQALHAALGAWQNFYVILGSSAGALTGLQFVVITLVTQARATGSKREIRAFATPTVIHFCTALLISAVMTTPWQALASLGLCLGACGVGGDRVLVLDRLARSQNNLPPRCGGLVLVYRFSVSRARGAGGCSRPDLADPDVISCYRCCRRSRVSFSGRP